MYIREIATQFPEKVLTNDQLAAQFPQWDIGQVEARTGVCQRFVAHENETALDLAVGACESLFARVPDLRERVDGVIFCTETPDYLIPSNACILQGRLGLPSVLALDVNLACSGFVYLLSLAKGLLASDQAVNLLLVTADTYSRRIHPKDRATRVLFGDGAAVTWVSASHGSSDLRVDEISLASDGRGYEAFYVPSGGTRRCFDESALIAEEDKNGNWRAPAHIHMDGMGILSFVRNQVPKQIIELCAKGGTELHDVDLFVPHQASKLALQYLRKGLGVDEERFFVNLQDVGNTVSASIPIALKDAEEKGRLEGVKTLVVSGFGAGLSWGTALLRLEGSCE